MDKVTLNFDHGAMHCGQKSSKQVWRFLANAHLSYVSHWSANDEGDNGINQGVHRYGIYLKSEEISRKSQLADSLMKAVWPVIV